MEEKIVVVKEDKDQPKFIVTDRFRQSWSPYRSVTEKTTEEILRKAKRL